MCTEPVFGCASFGTGFVCTRCYTFTFDESGGSLFGETLGSSGPAFDLFVVLGLVEDGTTASVDIFDSEGAGHGGNRLGVREPAVESL